MAQILDAVRASAIGRLTKTAFTNDTDGLKTAIKAAIPAGATGPAGPKGDTGSTGPAGPVGLVFRGAYAASTAYAAGDAVTHGGQTYRAKAAFTSTSTFDSSKWDLLAAKGADGAGGTGSGAGDRFNVQSPDGTWKLDKSAVDAIHAAGFVVWWVTDGAAAKLPTAADGLANGDIVEGAPVSQTVATITASDVPVAIDDSGTATDRVRLTKVTGVTWTVDGVDYPSADFTAATREVPFTKGGTCVVTAKASTSAYVVDGPSSWALTFQTSTAIITSETFSGAARTLAVGNDLWSTDAALGGAPKLVDISGQPSTVTAAGTLNLGAGSRFWIDNTAPNCSLSVKVVKVGSGSVDIVAARSSSVSATAAAAVSGTEVKLTGKHLAGNMYVSGPVSIQAGDVVEVAKAGTKVTLKVYRAGSQVGATQEITLDGDFTPTSMLIDGAFATGTAWEFDDLKLTSL